MIVDMHCHLDLYPDPFSVAAKCRVKRIYVLSVTTTPKAWEGTRKLEAGCVRIRTALGLHPQLVHQRVHELELFDGLLAEARYVGEIGLDGGKGYKKYWDIQLKAFRHILRSVSKAGGRIMTIHSRSSASAVLDELKGVTGIPILHWFSGTKDELRRAISMGCWFSVGPAMLCTKKGLQLTSEIPKDRVLTETDGPFAKNDGQALMPWDVERTYYVISEMWGIPKEEVQAKIMNNLKFLTLELR